MFKLVKKYAFVSTSYYHDGEWKNFFITHSGMTENDVLKIKEISDEYYRLWEECYAKERENALDGVYEDLRTDLITYLNTRINIGTCNYLSRKDYHKIWTEKDLIIEHFVIDN